MNWVRVYAVMYRHGCEARRNVNRLTDTFYWPIQNIIVWGFFTLYLAKQHQLEPGLTSYLLGATLLWGMFYSFQRDFATGFLEELWARNLINLFSTPLRVSEYIFGLLVINLIKAFLGLSMAALVAGLCYEANVFPSLLATIPYLAILIFFSISVGLFILE